MAISLQQAQNSFNNISLTYATQQFLNILGTKQISGNENDYFSISQDYLRKIDKTYLLDKYQQPLIAAAELYLKYSDLHLLHILLQNGIDINNSHDITLLHYAVLSKSKEFVKIVLGISSLEINKSDFLGRTALHYAVQLQVYDVVQLLCEKDGIDFYIKDNNGYTPLHYAVLMESIPIIDYLINHNKINVNIIDNVGYSPLCISVLCSSEKVFELMIQNEKQSYISRKGLTPLFLAKILPFELNSQFSSILNEKDQFITPALIIIKMLGHLFSIKGDLYGGLSQKVTYDCFVDILDSINSHFLPINCSLILRAAVKREYTALYYIDQLERFGITNVEMSWKGSFSAHSLSWTLCKINNVYISAIGNRGARAYRDMPGITFTIIENPSKLHKVIDKVLCFSGRKSKRDNSESLWLLRNSRFYIQHGINQDLMTRPLYFSLMKNQKEKNCGSIAATTSFKALLIFMMIRQYNMRIDYADFYSRGIYKEMMGKVRLRALEWVISLKRQMPQNVYNIIEQVIDFGDLYRQIYFKCRPNDPYRYKALLTLINHFPNLLYETKKNSV